MKNFIKIFFSIYLLLILTPNVSANENNYFVNGYGVSFSKNDYDFISNMYYKGYQNIITQEEFDSYLVKNSNLIESKYLDLFVPYGLIHETPAKILKISKIKNGSNTQVAIVLEWKKSPVNRSYDVIGARFEGVSLSYHFPAKLQYSDGSYSSSEDRELYNGIGTSIKLPSSGNSIIVSKTLFVNGSGKLYASYQHSVSSISLDNSKSYSFGSGGLGNVFKFSNNGYFDGMGGVDIDI